VRIIRIPYEALRRGELKYNIAIRPRDVIYAADPQTGFYFVGGHVARPGAYAFSGQKITIKDAIISASMLDGLAIPQRTDIIRKIHPDHEVFVRVDLTKIFSGEAPDIYLKPDDKVMVGTNALAPFLAAIRGGFRITYGFGFLFDRNYAYNNNGQAVGF
jgi:protein involved in polysaccharide export with SLBB domain